jgi:hypothetical protein
MRSPKDLASFNELSACGKRVLGIPVPSRHAMADKMLLAKISYLLILSNENFHDLTTELSAFRSLQGS